MGVIELEDMEFYAYHGCFKEEKIVGNYFLVNITLDGDCNKASNSDNIADAFNYQVIYDLTKEQMAISSDLLEHVAKRILDSIYATYPELNRASVKVSKMNPPLGGKTHKVSVTLSR